MKFSVNHPEYGEIVYNEPIFFGRSYITVNGVAVQRIRNRTFYVCGKELTIKGQVLTGVTAHIDGEVIQLLPHPVWYQWVLGLIPMVLTVLGFFIYITNPRAKSFLIPFVFCGIFGITLPIIMLTLMQLVKKHLHKLSIGGGYLLFYTILIFALAAIGS